MEIPPVSSMYSGIACISWLATNPQVTSVISGATRAEQVRANAAAASWRMGAEERAAIDALVVANL